MTNPTVEMAMFPLGSVLLPRMPLPLRVFEPRYLAMLASVLGDEPSEFGVVLIERGQEVGGGDIRFGIGTVARITELETGDGMIGLLALGSRRIEILRWLDDDPYPRAEVRAIDELVWSEDDSELLDEAERTVRSALAQASEFMELPWSADTELSDDPGDRIWQLAGIAPLGSLDQVALLRSETPGQLLDSVIRATEDARESLAIAWTDLEPDGDDETPDP